MKKKICTIIAVLCGLWGVTSSAAPSGDAAAVQLKQLRLYVPIKELPGRVGQDVVPITDYVKALQKAAATCIRPADQPGAKGVLIAVGIKPGKKSRIWCQAVEGSMSSELLLRMETELSKVEPISLKRKPMAFGMELTLRGQSVQKFPEFPDVWVAASKKTKSQLLIPPESCHLAR